MASSGEPATLRLRTLAKRLDAAMLRRDRVSACWDAPDRYRQHAVADNPFRRQRFDPPRFPYIALDGPSIRTILDLARAAGGAEIVGPHGTGKTLLLENLYEHARTTEICRYLRARPGRTTASVLAGPRVRWFIDRSERLPAAELMLLRAALRTGARTAVLTLHRSQGLPRLPLPPAGARLFAAVVRQALVLEGLPTDLVSESALSAAWTAGSGSVRVALEEMYHAFEDALCETAAVTDATRPAAG